MKTQHTPSPWGNHKWNCQEHQISAKGGTVALVSHSHSLMSEDEADANARLIAAAPDLLAALKACVERMSELQKHTNYPLAWPRVMAADAIAKAEGKV